MTNKKHHIFAATAGARGLISPKLCMMIEDVETILKGANNFSIQRIVFRLDALALSVIATAMWLAGWVAGWVAGCPSHSGIVSKRLNLSEHFFDH